MLFCFLFAVAAAASAVIHGAIDEDMKFVASTEKKDLNIASIATGSFDGNVQKTGWATLSVQTNAQYTNEQQAYAAGVFEGVLTADMVDAFVANVYPVHRSPSIHLKVKEPAAFAFVSAQFQWTQSTAFLLRNSSDFWQQVHLQFEQMGGLADGYAQAKPNVLDPFSTLDFYLLSGSDSIGDIVGGLPFRSPTAKHAPSGKPTVPTHCSAIVRFTGSDLFTAHATWTSYNQMLRIMKSYDFGFSKNDGSPIPGSLIQFSSYPGSIWSSDDFYQIGVAGQPMNFAVWETTSSVYNTSLWQALSEQTVLTFIRVTTANRLAASGPDWAGWFKMFHSGTYTNAWMVVDYGLFRARSDPSAPTLDANTAYMIEELPGLTAEGDMTDFINTAGYFASFNVWYFYESNVASGTPYMVEKYGPSMSFDGAPRNLIFAREAPKTQTLADVQALLRFNEWQTDPYSVGTRSGRSPCNAIACRGDLGPGPSCFGAIDAKVTSSALMAASKFTAVAGPTWGGKNQLPAFNWQNASCTSTHAGQPNLFNFGYSTFF